MSQTTELVCGMPIDRDAAQAQGLFANRAGRSYFFTAL